MDAFLDVSGIVKRAKQTLSSKKDNELASYLGVSCATLSNWCTGDRIDSHLLLNKMRDVDLNWLLVGKGTPRHQARLCKSGSTSSEVQMIHNSKTVGALDDRSITLYDTTAATNLKMLFTNKQQYMVERVQIPGIPLCDGAVCIDGDSMYPILKSGDVVSFEEIDSSGSLIYGEMYLVSFIIEGDECLAVKYVNRSEKEGCLKLVSHDAHRGPVDIPFDTVNAMVTVRSSIRRHMMM